MGGIRAGGSRVPDWFGVLRGGQFLAAGGAGEGQSPGGGEVTGVSGIGRGPFLAARSGAGRYRVLGVLFRRFGRLPLFADRIRGE